MNYLEPAPTPFDLNLRLFKTDIRVSVWFWVLPGLFGLVTAEILGIGAFIVTITCFFVSILLHEFGHVFAGWTFGAKSYVVLNGIGGVAVGAAELSKRWQRIVVFLAGPLVQLLLGGTLWLTADWMIQPQNPRGNPYVLLRHGVSLLTGINIAWPLFNLLPIPPLDGGQVAREILGYFLEKPRPPWERDDDWWKKG